MDYKSIKLWCVGTYYLYISEGLVEHGINKSNYNNAILVPCESIRKLKKSGIISGNDLRTLIGLKDEINAKYYYKNEGKMFIANSIENNPWSIFSNALQGVANKNLSNDNSDIFQFRLRSRDSLISAILEENAKMEDAIEAFAAYTISDAYSLWVYNPYTKAFTAEICSEKYDHNIVTQNDNTSLFSFIKSGKQHECRAPNSKYSHYKYFKEQKTLNRIFLKFGDDDTVGVLSLYSQRENFPLMDETLRHIKIFLETKYFSYLAEKQSELDLINDIFAKHDGIYDVNKLFIEITKKICEEFSFEACSIFEKIKNKNALELICSHNSKFTGRPLNPVIYDLSIKTMTGLVYTDNEYKEYGCYDLKNSKTNSHIFDEPTTCSPTNWIGFLLFADNKKFGVLRVKNKYRVNNDGFREIIPFRSSDYRRLRNVCKNISITLYIMQEIGKLNVEKENIENRYHDLLMFNDLFLHEIRTPISNFTLTPSYVIKVLQKSGLDSKTISRPISLLKDLKSMSTRLKHIISVHNLDELFDAAKIEKIYMLKDVVYPVINIIDREIMKMHNKNINIDETNMNNVLIYGDKLLLQLAFQALLDNAAKYSSNESNTINIIGDYDKSHSYFLITVSNYGVDIEIEDVDKIFDYRYRGINAKKEGMVGTGMGLYAAKRVMDKINGEIILTRRSNPVSFTLKIPTA